MVTAPVLASARPASGAAIQRDARVSENRSHEVVVHWMVAEVPTCQNTLQGKTPIRDTLELVPVIRVLPI